MSDYQSRHSGATIDTAVDTALNLQSGVGPRSMQSAPAPFPGYETAQITTTSGALEFIAIGFDPATLVTQFGNGELTFRIMVGGTPKELAMGNYGDFYAIYDMSTGGDPWSGPSGTYNLLQYTGSIAEGAASHAEGEGTRAAGSFSHAEGHGTIAGGLQSHAEGYRSETGPDAPSAHAEGQLTKALGAYSHSEGAGTVALGIFSHAEGISSIALDQCAHAEGEYARIARGWARGHRFMGGQGATSQSILLGDGAVVTDTFPYVFSKLRLFVGPNSALRFRGQAVVRNETTGAFQTGKFEGVVTRAATGPPVLSHTTVTWDNGTAEGTLALAVDAGLNEFRVVVTSPAGGQWRQWSVDLHGTHLFSDFERVGDPI